MDDDAQDFAGYLDDEREAPITDEFGNLIDEEDLEDAEDDTGVAVGDIDDDESEEEELEDADMAVPA